MAQTSTLQRPEEVDGTLFTSNVSGFVILHLLALLALNPYLFSWTGVVLVFVGNFVFGGLGINIGYHRLLTHRSFRCPKWLEYTLAVLGVCCMQDSPSRWVAVHRLHHQHTDKRPDPHSPLVSLFWGWMGWLIFKNRHLRKRSTINRYAKDLSQDPFYQRLHRGRLWLYIYVAHAVLFLLCGYLTGWLMTGTAAGALQFGLSVLVWGVFVRTVYVWNVTWTINWVTHRWGYRNFETHGNDRNNWFIALLTHGEGWHNNHHAFPRSAAQGLRWWEFDPSYAVIVLFSKVGLATDVLTPRFSSRNRAASSASNGSSRPPGRRHPAVSSHADVEAETPDSESPGDPSDCQDLDEWALGEHDRVDPSHAPRVPPPHHEQRARHTHPG